MLYKRKDRSGIRRGKLFQWAIFLALLAYLIFTLYNQQALLDKIQTEHNQAVAQLKEESEKNAQLQVDYASIGTLEFYERIARRVFGYIAPDEKVYYESKN